MPADFTPGLIKKGMVYSAERGTVAFTVPHFGKFLRIPHPHPHPRPDAPQVPLMILEAQFQGCPELPSCRQFTILTFPVSIRPGRLLNPIPGRQPIQPVSSRSWRAGCSVRRAASRYSVERHAEKEKPVAQPPPQSPGWYPGAPGLEVWWNGERWTEQTRPAQHNQPGQQPFQGPLPGWQLPKPPKKPFFKRTWVIVTGAVLGVLIIASIAGAGLFLRLTSDRTFDDVTELRIAAEDAGLQCPDWKRKSDTTAECSYTAVLIIVDNEEQLKQKVADMQKNPLAETEERLRQLGFPVTEPFEWKYRFLAGKNWINSDDAADLADELGGKVYTNY